MQPVEINLTTLLSPVGWDRRVVSGGGGREILAARHPVPPLRLGPEVEGWFRPLLGLFRFPGKFCEMEVKFGEAAHWQHLRPVHFINDRQGGLQYADLDPVLLSKDDMIQIRPVERHGSVAGLASIRLEPVDGPGPEWRRQKVGAVCDTHGMLARGRITSATDLEALLMPFVASEFDRICWGTGAGSFRMLYFSKVLPYFGEGKTRFYNESNTRVAAAMETLRRNKIDPLDVALSFCHANGLQLWANDRICHAFAPGGFDDDFAAPFYLDNPQLRTVHQDGSRGASLSLAHAEFQDLKLALYREWAERGVDGIYIDLQRKPGVMGVDAPVVEAFEREMGRRPEKGDFSSEPWLGIRAGFVTEFMSRVRGVLDEVGGRQGRRIPVAVQGFAGRRYTKQGMRDENLAEGYDIQAWAQAGLIDIYAPSNGRHYQPLPLVHHARYLENSECRLWGCLGQHHDCLFADDYQHEIYFGDDPDKRITPIADLDPLRILHNAADCYAQGAEGVFLWEAGETAQCRARWNYLRRLGPRADLHGELALGPFDGRHHLIG